uniref:non-specific serine/threonine protein kinase n=1 Tax=Salix viminalis TaxID=40686 RepID=A0A6N2NJ79_SALVM
MADAAGLMEAAGARFSSLELIGRGSFGDVYKAFDKELNKEVAIKVIDLEESEDEIEDIQKEISVLQQCRSPYITEYYGSYLHQTKLWIIMEYMAGGSVADLLQSGPPLDEMSIACILRDLLYAVEYLHNKGTMHRDIKAANILLSENGDVKVADFGVSVQLTRTISRRKTFVGTPFWMAPEVIQNSEGYNVKADIWSIGITAIEMAKGEPPLADIHPMRVLFIIPRENPPQLDEHFSRPMKEFVSFCLKKVPAERPFAKDLLKHRFIRNARKSPRLLERIRERPKYQIMDAETPRNGPKGMEEGFDTVKVARDSRADGTVRASAQGKPFKNAGWDFSIGGSQTTGTVRSAARPPQVREKKTDISYNKDTQRRASESGNHLLSASGNALQESLELSYGKDARDPYHDDHQDNSHDDDDLSVSGSGTVVIRTPKRSQPSALFRDQNNTSSSTLTTFEDASTSGTVVYRGQHDESDSPRTSKSRLGMQEKTSSASLEDSALNLAKARAAFQGGLRKGNARERFVPSKNNSDGLENRREQLTNSSDSSRSSREYFDAPKAFARSQQAIDVEESARIASSSTPLSVLLIPSLKEVSNQMILCISFQICMTEAVADVSERAVFHAVANSFVNMERVKPGSCDIFVRNLLQQLASSKESSLGDLQELAARLLSKCKTTPEETQNGNTDADSMKKQPTKEFNSNANLSPLARFLLSRWQGQASRDVN